MNFEKNKLKRVIRLSNSSLVSFARVHRSFNLPPVPVCYLLYLDFLISYKLVCLWTRGGRVSRRWNNASMIVAAPNEAAQYLNRATTHFRPPAATLFHCWTNILRVNNRDTHRTWLRDVWLCSTPDNPNEKSGRGGMKKREQGHGILRHTWHPFRGVEGETWVVWIFKLFLSY